MNGYLGNFKTIFTPVARKCKLLNLPPADETCTKKAIWLFTADLKREGICPVVVGFFERFGIKITATVVYILSFILNRLIYTYLIVAG